MQGITDTPIALDPLPDQIISRTPVDGDFHAQELLPAEPFDSDVSEFRYSDETDEEYAIDVKERIKTIANLIRKPIVDVEHTIVEAIHDLDKPLTEAMHTAENIVQQIEGPVGTAYSYIDYAVHEAVDEVHQLAYPGHYDKSIEAIDGISLSSEVTISDNNIEASTDEESVVDLLKSGIEDTKEIIDVPYEEAKKLVSPTLGVVKDLVEAPVTAAENIVEGPIKDVKETLEEPLNMLESLVGPAPTEGIDSIPVEQPNLDEHIDYLRHPLQLLNDPVGNSNALEIINSQHDGFLADIKLLLHEFTPPIVDNVIDAVLKTGPSSNDNKSTAGRILDATLPARFRGPIRRYLERIAQDLEEDERRALLEIQKERNILQNKSL